MRPCRIINLTFIFLIYCSIQVYSASTEATISEDDELASVSSSNESSNIKFEETTIIMSNDQEVLVHPTYRPKRTYCIPPAIEQFPKSFMPQNLRRNGGRILHVLIVLFIFAALAVICNGYFVPSIHRICEELKLSPDAAGGTFMAVGTSIYKFGTVGVGVFKDKDDIGVSDVIGSVAFNIMFVTSICALYSETVCHLNWRPLVRDCIFCCISILVMSIVIFKDYVKWYEALTMILFYVVYCAAIYITSLKKRVDSLSTEPINQTAIDVLQPKMTDAEIEMVGKPVEDAENSESKDHNEIQENVNPLEKPLDSSLLAKITWCINYPIHYMCRFTIPDCRTEKHRNWYAITFFISMIWITFFSYLMVWQITIIGFTIAIPDRVMDITFVAAGVSVPRALTSIAVIKEGYSIDMAISNAVGSNVFDILICLPWLWLIQTTIIDTGGYVYVISKGLTILSLLSTVVVLLLLVRLNGWKLDLRLGKTLMVLYFLFITIASMYELSVFGSVNPRECPTNY